MLNDFLNINVSERELKILTFSDQFAVIPQLIIIGNLFSFRITILEPGEILKFGLNSLFILILNLDKSYKVNLPHI